LKHFMALVLLKLLRHFMGEFMKKWIALFRGINVGGKNKLPMKELKTQMQNAGFENVKTYIQSGNVVFESKKTDVNIVSQQLSELVENSHGFLPKVIILSVDKFSRAIKNCPFKVDIEQGNLLHYFFLEHAPKNVDFARIDAIKTASEEWRIIDDVFYLYTPDGFGRSQLAIKAEKLIGEAATARNWRSVSKIFELTK